MKSVDPEKKKKVVSLALEPSIHEALKRQSAIKDVSVSCYVSEIIEKHLSVDQGSVKIVLTIPKEKTNDSESLQQWLNQKSLAIVTHFKNGVH